MRTAIVVSLRLGAARSLALRPSLSLSLSLLSIPLYSLAGYKEVDWSSDDGSRFSTTCGPARPGPGPWMRCAGSQRSFIGAVRFNARDLGRPGDDDAVYDAARWSSNAPRASSSYEYTD